MFQNERDKRNAEGGGAIRSCMTKQRMILKHVLSRRNEICMTKQRMISSPSSKNKLFFKIETNLIFFVLNRLK